MGRKPFLSVERFAQIAKADISFGNLTVLVGPQATGKSLLLQLLKLAIDGPRVLGALLHNGFEPSSPGELLQIYFGDGLGHAWSARTRVRSHLGPLSPQSLLRGRYSYTLGSLFYIPAQRTLVLAEGWPRSFRQYSNDVPFVVRQFGEVLWAVVSDLDPARTIFPQEKRLKAAIRDYVDNAIFHGGRLHIESGMRKQLVLDYKSKHRIPYMAWTAGQREFVPLMLGFYFALPSTKITTRRPIEWIVIEEPEMGLHPKGIMAVMLLVLELLDRGYRVVLSTHSPLVVDVVWALNRLAEHGAGWRSVADLFEIEHAGPDLMRVAKSALKIDSKVYYVDYDGKDVWSTDISSLDPGSDDPRVAGWGGLTGLSGRIGNVVAAAVNES